MSTKINITVSDAAQAPTKGTEGAAAFDLKANHDTVLAAGQTTLIKTGINAAIPKGMVGLVCSRSGLALKESVFVLNAPGLVDSDYRGEVGVILHKAAGSGGAFTIKKGDRIAQLMIVRHEDVEFEVVDSLDQTERGNNGFGSTGQ